MTVVENTSTVGCRILNIKVCLEQQCMSFPLRWAAAGSKAGNIVGVAW